MAGFIKICGITSLVDARAAVESGADALGFVFPASPRRIEPEPARLIIRELPGRVLKVGVFVGGSCDEIAGAARLCGLDALQLHGDYPVEFAPQLSRWLLLKAIAVGAPSALEQAAQWRRWARALLLDSSSPDGQGGTGKTFDWRQALVFREFAPIVVAGGLKPANVAEAIAAADPWGVDVASGVETVPGRKDARLVAEFIARARAAFDHVAVHHTE